MIKLALERITLGGRVWLDGYIRLEEQPIEVSGANVPVDSVHLYAKDNGGGISRLFYKDDGQVEHEVVTTGSGGGGVTDHGALTGLANDDHAQYLLTADATSRALFAANWLDLTDLGATTLHSHAWVTDHGALTGLADDDHTQYALLVGRSGGQVLIGGTGVDDDITLKPTSGVGSTSSSLFLAVGNDGSIPGLRITSTGKVGIGSNSNHGSQLYLPNQTASEYALQISGATSQSASLQVWQNVGGDTISEVTFDGVIATYPALGGGFAVGINSMSTAAFHSASTATRQFLFNRAEIGTANTDGIYFSCKDDGQFWFVNQEASAASIFRFYTNNNDFAFTIDSLANCIIDNAVSSPGTGTKGLVFGDGTALSSMASNTAGLYANDVGGTVQMFAINEAGTAQVLTGSDPYTQYALLAGRAAGQTIKGSDSGAGGGLTLQATAGTADSGTLLKLKYGDNGASDGITLMGVGGFVGIHCTPSYSLQLNSVDPCVFELRNTTEASEPALKLIVTGGLSTFQATWENSGANQDLRFMPTTAAGAQTETMRVSYTNNVLIGNGPTPPSTGNSGIVFADGTALSSMGSNTAGIYANDVGGTVTMFNIAEDGRIKDLLWPRVARCGTQFDKVDATLADATGLTHTLAAAITYEFEAILHVTASLAGGSKFAMTGDGSLSATSITYHVDLLDNTTNAHTITSRQTALAGAAGQAGTTEGICRIVGTIVVNAAGALRVQFAQNAANGTSSVLVNSSFTVRKID